MSGGLLRSEPMADGAPTMSHNHGDNNSIRTDGSEMENSARKVRKRAGPFKRSRTGCGTCKRRGKKCDEDWTDEGVCQRCLVGDFQCTGRTLPSAPGMASSSSRRGVGPGRRSSSSDNTSVTFDAGLPIPMTTTDTASIAGESIGAVLPPLSTASVHPGQLLLPTPLNTSYVDPSSLWSDTPSSAGASTNTNDAAAFLSSFAAPQPLYNFPGSFATHPSAFLTTSIDGGLAIDSTPFAWNSSTANSLWGDLSKNFDPTPEETGAQNNAHQLNSNSRVLFLNSEKPMRQGVSLAEIYARVVESWLVGIPSTTRDYARARILALNDNNSVMRNVRFAVSAAYIFLFACCSDRDDVGDTRPKLVELACKGAGLLESDPGSRLGIGEEAGTRGDTKQVKDDEAANTTKKLRLYVDQVSTPFAADTESVKWTEDAIRELKEVIVTDKSQLSDLLWGVIDLQLVEFIRGGASPSYHMLALGDRLVRAAMKENYPPLLLSSLRTSDTLSLRFYALSDISRCIVQRGRRTIFNFWSDAATEDTANSPQGDDDEPWATYLGLPDAIVILLAEIVNLCAELDSSTLSSVSIKDQADELELALKAWSSQSFSTTDSVDSTALISRTIAGELWRLAALVLLYQSVHRVGGLHPVLRQAQTQILSLLDSITRLPSGDLWGFIALPAFLAACLSITESDRKRSMQHLLRPGPERVWLDDITLVEKVWEETDQTGRLPDWHDKMIREGLSIAFF